MVAMRCIVTSSRTGYTMLPQGSKAAGCMVCSFDSLICVCISGTPRKEQKRKEKKRKEKKRKGKERKG